MSISNIIFFLKLTNMNITITITTISTIITNMTTMTNIIIFLKLTNMNNPLSTTCPPNPIPPPIVRGKCFNLDPKEKKTAKLPPGGGSLKNAMHSGNLNAPTIALKKKKKKSFLISTYTYMAMQCNVFIQCALCNVLLTHSVQCIACVFPVRCTIQCCTVYWLYCTIKCLVHFAFVM